MRPQEVKVPVSSPVGVKHCVPSPLGSGGSLGIQNVAMPNVPLIVVFEVLYPISFYIFHQHLKTYELQG